MSYYRIGNSKLVSTITKPRPFTERVRIHKQSSGLRHSIYKPLNRGKHFYVTPQALALFCTRLVTDAEELDSCFKSDEFLEKITLHYFNTSIPEAKNSIAEIWNLNIKVVKEFVANELRKKKENTNASKQSADSSSLQKSTELNVLENKLKSSHTSIIECREERSKSLSALDRISSETKHQDDDKSTEDLLEKIDSQTNTIKKCQSPVNIGDTSKRTLKQTTGSIPKRHKSADSSKNINEKSEIKTGYTQSSDDAFDEVIKSLVNELSTKVTHSVDRSKKLKKIKLLGKKSLESTLSQDAKKTKDVKSLTTKNKQLLESNNAVKKTNIVDSASTTHTIVKDIKSSIIEPAEIPETSESLDKTNVIKLDFLESTPAEIIRGTVDESEKNCGQISHLIKSTDKETKSLAPVDTKSSERIKDCNDVVKETKIEKSVVAEFNDIVIEAENSASNASTLNLEKLLTEIFESHSSQSDREAIVSKSSENTSNLNDVDELNIDKGTELLGQSLSIPKSVDAEKVEIDTLAESIPKSNETINELKICEIIGYPKLTTEKEPKSVEASELSDCRKVTETSDIIEELKVDSDIFFELSDNESMSRSNTRVRKTKNIKQKSSKPALKDMLCKETNIFTSLEKESEQVSDSDDKGVKLLVSDLCEPILNDKEIEIGKPFDGEFSKLLLQSSEKRELIESSLSEFPESILQPDPFESSDEETEIIHTLITELSESISSDTCKETDVFQPSEELTKQLLPQSVKLVKDKDEYLSLENFAFSLELKPRDLNKSNFNPYVLITDISTSLSKSDKFLASNFLRNNSEKVKCNQQNVQSDQNSLSGDQTQKTDLVLSLDLQNNEAQSSSEIQQTNQNEIAVSTELKNTDNKVDSSVCNDTKSKAVTLKRKKGIGNQNEHLVETDISDKSSDKNDDVVTITPLSSKRRKRDAKPQIEHIVAQQFKKEPLKKKPDLEKPVVEPFKRFTDLLRENALSLSKTDSKKKTEELKLDDKMEVTITPILKPTSRDLNISCVADSLHCESETSPNSQFELYLSDMETEKDEELTSKSEKDTASECKIKNTKLVIKKSLNRNKKIDDIVDSKMEKDEKTKTKLKKDKPEPNLKSIKNTKLVIATPPKKMKQTSEIENANSKLEKAEKTILKSKKDKPESNRKKIKNTKLIIAPSSEKKQEISKSKVKPKKDKTDSECKIIMNTKLVIPTSPDKNEEISENKKAIKKIEVEKENAEEIECNSARRPRRCKQSENREKYMLTKFGIFSNLKSKTSPEKINKDVTPNKKVTKVLSPASVKSDEGEDDSSIATVEPDLKKEDEQADVIKEESIKTTPPENKTNEPTTSASTSLKKGGKKLVNPVSKRKINSKTETPSKVAKTSPVFQENKTKESSTNSETETLSVEQNIENMANKDDATAPKELSVQNLTQFFIQHITSLEQMNNDYSWGSVYEKASLYFFGNGYHFNREYLFNYWKMNTDGIQDSVKKRLDQRCSETLDDGSTDKSDNSKSKTEKMDADQLSTPHVEMTASQKYEELVSQLQFDNDIEMDLVEQNSEVLSNTVLCYPNTKFSTDENSVNEIQLIIPEHNDATQSSNDKIMIISNEILTDGEFPIVYFQDDEMIQTVEVQTKSADNSVDTQRPVVLAEASGAVTEENINIQNLSTVQNIFNSTEPVESEEHVKCEQSFIVSNDGLLIQDTLKTEDDRNNSADTIKTEGNRNNRVDNNEHFSENNGLAVLSQAVDLLPKTELKENKKRNSVSNKKQKVVAPLKIKIKNVITKPFILPQASASNEIALQSCSKAPEEQTIANIKITTFKIDVDYHKLFRPRNDFVTFQRHFNVYLEGLLEARYDKCVIEMEGKRINKTSKTAIVCLNCAFKSCYSFSCTLYFDYMKSGKITCNVRVGGELNHDGVLRKNKKVIRKRKRTKPRKTITPSMLEQKVMKRNIDKYDFTFKVPYNELFEQLNGEVEFKCDYYKRFRVRFKEHYQTCEAHIASKKIVSFKTTAVILLQCIHKDCCKFLCYVDYKDIVNDDCVTVKVSTIGKVNHTTPLRIKKRSLAYRRMIRKGRLCMKKKKPEDDMKIEEPTLSSDKEDASGASDNENRSMSDQMNRYFDSSDEDDDSGYDLKFEVKYTEIFENNESSVQYKPDYFFYLRKGFETVYNRCKVNILSKRIGQTTGLAKVFMYCHYKSCCCFICNININNIIDGNVMVYVKIIGEFCHQNNLKTKLTMKQNLQKNTRNYRLFKALQQRALSDKVMNTSRQKSIAKEIHELMNTENEETRYIQAVLQPFVVYLHSRYQTDVARNELVNSGSLTIYFASSAEVIRPTQEYKNMRYYSGVVRANFSLELGSIILPILETVTSQQDTETLRNWIQNFNTFCENLPFTRVVTEFRWPLISALVQGWAKGNTMDVYEYMSICYDKIMLNGSDIITENIIPVYVCRESFSKNVLYTARKCVMKGKQIACFLAAIITDCLMFSRTIDEAKAIFFDFLMLADTKCMTENVEKVLRKFQRRIPNYNNAQAIDTDIDLNLAQYSQSPFYKEFNALRQFNHNSDLPKDAPVNKYYCPAFVDMVLKKYMWCLPLWVPYLMCEGNVEELSNSAVKGWMEMVKMSILEKRQRIKCQNFIQSVKSFIQDLRVHDKKVQ